MRTLIRFALVMFVLGCTDAASVTLPAAATPPVVRGGASDTTLTVTVARGVTGNVAVDFATCAADDRPIWFAHQDGDGAWTPILDSAGVYRFDVTADRGGYAFVAAKSGGAIVQLATRAELTRAAHVRCAPTPTGLKSISGTLAPSPVGTSDVVYVGLGGPNPGREGWGPIETNPFTLTGIAAGGRDLIAYRSDPSGFGPTERALIRRDQDLPDRGSLGTIDFTGADAFAPATAALTITGVRPFDQVGHGMSYRTGAACALYDLYDQLQSSAAVTMRGIPAARQRETDFHQVGVSGVEGTFARYAYESFHTLTDRVVALPAALPTITATAPAGGHKRIQVAFTLPPEYRNGVVELWMGGGRGYTIVTASSAWLGGPSVTLAVPDLARVTGWRSAFLPPPDSTVWWGLHATGANEAASGGPCAEHARSVSALVNGRR
ncbi:hypothetical protein J421_1031 [Gemmatirosa kalamazoonensis]|uniref:Uncharacterized protein n=1 Tax=Gemmatirosa kalamazoonensis TaxID=861299 RepID=W0RGP0_9BACT|nr:hypothetical protein [Gemmatirosa kalamazoonensis]AHG88568.1 hypothetical protein J421_1031 [Gemmatirosa kalamazoonensis]